MGAIIRKKDYNREQERNKEGERERGIGAGKRERREGAWQQGISRKKFNTFPPSLVSSFLSS